MIKLVNSAVARLFACNAIPLQQPPCAALIIAIRSPGPYPLASIDQS